MRLGIGLAIGFITLLPIAFVGPMAWQLYVGATSPAVAAIKNHPLRTTATVMEPVIDGFGGDPALSYRYTVGGKTYNGFDVGNEMTGDVLSMKPGDPVAIIYAATLPQESCLVGSTDCPNDVYDPEIVAYMFWVILVGGSAVGGIGLGVGYAIRAFTRRHAA